MISFPPFAAIRMYLYAGVLLVYSFGIWHVSSKYTSSGYLKEKAELIQKAAETKQQRQELADQIGAKLEETVGKIHITQKNITQEVIHEITKEPVYTDCRTTPDGVRLIEQSIDNQGQSTGK